MNTQIQIAFGEPDLKVEIANKLQEQYPHNLILVPAGTFLRAFNVSAYALHTLKGYKLKLAGPASNPHLAAGFPLANYKQRLWPIVEEHGISYIVAHKAGLEFCEATTPSMALIAIAPSVLQQVMNDMIENRKLNTAATKKALQNPQTQDFIFKTKAIELDSQLLQDCMKLPRDIRATWGENVRETMQRIMRNTFLYGNEDNKPNLLKQLSADVDLLRHYISEAQTLNRFKIAFEHRVGLVVELGRILGGLQRAQKVLP